MDPIFKKMIWLMVLGWLVLSVGCAVLVKLISTAGGLQCVVGHVWNSTAKIEGCPK